jgi:hypothetical protein
VPLGDGFELISVIVSEGAYVTPNSAELLALLSKPMDSPAVSQVLQELGAVPEQEFEGRGTAFDATAPARGLGMTFLPASHLRDGESLGVPPATLLTAGVFFYSEGLYGHRGFAGALPYGLEFAMSRPAVHALLGVPSGSSAKYKNDRWNWDSLFLTLDFNDDEQSIKLVTVGLHWKPRTTAPAAKGQP